MPKAISEVANMQRGVKRAGGKKIDFEPIVEQIIETGQLYTVNEVWTDLVAKKVCRFRTKKLLDKAAKRADFDRYYDGKRFWYGIATEEEE